MNGEKLQDRLYFPQFTGNHSDAFILHNGSNKSHQYIPEGNEYDHP